MKITFIKLNILVLLAGGVISCSQKQQVSYNAEAEQQVNFEPLYEYAPDSGTQVQLFPPRLRGKEGVSLSRLQKTDTAIVWIAGLNDITLTCSLKNENGRKEIYMTVSNNGSKDQLLAIRYPEVHYLMNNDSTLRVLDPTFGGVLEPKTPYPMVDVTYPGFASFCATLVTGKDKALGIAVRNKQQLSAHIRHLPARPAGQMSIELERILVPAGETIELPSAYIASGDDWSDVLKPYREWFSETFKPKMKIPEWYETGEFALTHTAHCMVPSYPPAAAPGIWVFDPAFKVRTMEDVKRDVDRGVEQTAKSKYKPLFYLFGWWKMMETFKGLHMFDAVCGDYTEGHELAKQAVKYIHSNGGKTFLYTNFISAGEESRLFREQPGLFARNEDGEPVRNASYPMYLFCPGSPEIRTYWDKVLNYVLIEMDADGIFLDQLGGGTPSPKCTDPSHHHAHPDSYGEEYLELVEYVAKKAKEIKTDAIVCCELIDDVRSQYIDLVQGFGYNRPKERIFFNAEQAANTPPAEYMVFLKYINPHANMFPERTENVAIGAPGYPSDTIYTRFKAQFKSGLQPCKTSPVGAMAYLYGPVNGEAVLAVKAAEEIKEVTVYLPENFAPVTGGSHTGKLDKNGNLVVSAGKSARFYKLEKKD